MLFSTTSNRWASLEKYGFSCRGPGNNKFRSTGRQKGTSGDHLLSGSIMLNATEWSNVNGVET